MVAQEALEGQIVSADDLAFEIRLRIGTTITVPPVKDLGYGDKVWVCYDYTRNRVREVMSDATKRDLDIQREGEPDGSEYCHFNALSYF